MSREPDLTVRPHAMTGSNQRPSQAMDGSAMPRSGRRREARWAFAALLGAAVVMAAPVADAGVAGASPTPAAPVLAPAVVVTCPGTKPKARPCEVVVCNNGEWASYNQAPGTACNDSNACTYGDVCDAAGACRGTPITCAPRGPCELSACNGTSTCVVTTRASGTVCPYSNTGNPADAPNPCENTCDGTSYRCQP